MQRLQHRIVERSLDSSLAKLAAEPNPASLEAQARVQRMLLPKQG